MTAKTPYFVIDPPYYRYEKKMSENLLVLHKLFFYLPTLQNKAIPMLHSVYCSYCKTQLSLFFFFLTSKAVSMSFSLSLNPKADLVPFWT